jgi:hypothetical protein
MRDLGGATEGKPQPVTVESSPGVGFVEACRLPTLQSWSTRR